MKKIEKKFFPKMKKKIFLVFQKNFGSGKKRTKSFKNIFSFFKAKKKERKFLTGL